MRFAYKLLSALKRLMQKRLKHQAHHLWIGQKGEYFAKQYLKQKGYRIITCNWRHQNKEIDLVALDKQTLVFVEVKTRQKDALQCGYIAVDHAKKKHLQACSTAYLKMLRHPPKTFRFDIVEIQYDEKHFMQAHHYENIPLFSKYFHCNRKIPN